jgi:hypothetical protein
LNLHEIINIQLLSKFNLKLKGGDRSGGYILMLRNGNWLFQLD